MTHYIITADRSGFPVYAVFIFIAFVLGFTISFLLLRRDSVNNTLIAGSVLLNSVSAIIGGQSLAEIKHIGSGKQVIGLSSLGCGAGIAIGTIILALLFKEYARSLISAYILPMPLIYGIAKIGCFFTGCCQGMNYSGIFSVMYRGDADICHQYLFPVQILESIVFIIIFITGIHMYQRKFKYCDQIVLFLCGLGKGSLDFLRFSHGTDTLSFNQIICMFVCISSIIWGIMLFTTKTSHQKYNF